MSQVRALIVAGLILFVGMWVVLGLRHHHRTNEWAHGGDHVRVQAAIEATDDAGFGGALAAAGGDRNGAIVGVEQGFVVQVSWTGTPGPGGHYQFILLDDRVSPPQPVRTASGSAGSDHVTLGWDGRYDVLHERYPWLAATAGRRQDDGSYADTTEAVGVRAKNRGSATLAFYTLKDAIPTTAPAHDLTLAMFFVDADGEVRWARRIPLEPLATVIP